MKPGDISSHLPVEELRQKYFYNPETGVFTKRALTKYQKERVAGCKSGSGYIRIRINRRIYFAHRLAWYYVTGSNPTNLIDHINGNKQDNRFCNLREADYSQNMMNSGIPSSNTSGVKGVSWHASEGKWRSEGKLNGKKIHLGHFPSKELASQAYQEFAIKTHGEFYRPPSSKN